VPSYLKSAPTEGVYPDVTCTDGSSCITFTKYFSQCVPNKSPKAFKNCSKESGCDVGFECRGDKIQQCAPVNKGAAMMSLSK
jgi:hypothetical protein